MLLQIRFIFRGIYGEDFGTYSKIQVSGKLSDHTINWVWICRTLSENWIHKAAQRKDRDQQELITWDRMN